VLVFTLLSTWIGSGSLFGSAGLGYRSGFSALWQSAGAWVGIGIIYFLAPRVRRLAKYTVPETLHQSVCRGYPPPPPHTHRRHHARRGRLRAG
jgi:Na+/proline symporter